MKVMYTQACTVAFRSVVTLCLIMLTSVVAWGAVGDVVATGTCGENVKWTFTENGQKVQSSSLVFDAVTLTITGTGPITEKSYLYGDVSGVRSIQITDVIIGEGITAICNGAFGSCRNLKHVVIPSSITSIGDNAFNGCRSLSSVSVPDGVSKIGPRTFSECDSLRSVTLGRGVKSIGSAAFYNCSRLVSLRLKRYEPNDPDPITTISGRPGQTSFSFEGCISLSTIILPDAGRKRYLVYEEEGEEYRTYWDAFKISDDYDEVWLREIIRSEHDTLFHAGETNMWTTWCDNIAHAAPKGVTVYVPSSARDGKLHLYQLTATVTIPEEDRTGPDDDGIRALIPSYTPVLIKRESNMMDGDIVATYVQSAPLHTEEGWRWRYESSGYSSPYGVYHNAPLEETPRRDISNLLGAAPWGYDYLNYEKQPRKYIAGRDDSVWGYIGSLQHTYGRFYGNVCRAGEKITSMQLFANRLELVDDVFQPVADEDKGLEPHHCALTGTPGSNLQLCPDRTPVILTFSDGSYCTFYNSNADLILPPDMKARIVSLSPNDGSVIYKTIASGDTEINTVPAGTPVLLQGRYGASRYPSALELSAHTDTRDFSALNLLHASPVATTTTGSGKHYKLTLDDTMTAKWEWGNDTGSAFEAGANQVWLNIPEEQAHNTSSYAIRDFFDYIPNPVPENLEVSKITFESAKISWTPQFSEETLIGFTYQYKKGSDENWSELITVNTTSVTLTELEDSTWYEFRVKAVYEGMESQTVSCGFSTPYPLPYSCDFESDMDGWSFVDHDTHAKIIDTDHHSGEHCYDLFGILQHMIAPRFLGKTGVRVSFYYKTPYTNYPNTFQIGYSTTTADTTAFTWGGVVTSNSNKTWLKYEETLPPGTVYVALRKEGGYNFYIDDFQFTETEPNPAPYQVYAKNTTPESATLCWGGQADDYFLQYRKEGDTEWRTGETTENTFELAGLTPATTYEFQVRAVYRGDQHVVTDWSVLAKFATPRFVRSFRTAGNWNVASNWESGIIPTANDDVKIYADAVIPAGTVASANDIQLEGGSVTIKDGGQLRHNSVWLWVTMEKEFTGYGNDTGSNHYYLISSPIRDTTRPDYTQKAVDVEGLLSGDYDLYDFSYNEWVNHKVSSQIFDGHHGKLYATKDSKTIRFSGYVGRSVSNSFRLDNITNVDERWILVGNPYVGNAYVTYQNKDESRPAAEFYKMNAEGNGYVKYENSMELIPGEGAFVKAYSNGSIYIRTDGDATEPTGTADKPKLVNHGINYNYNPETPAFNIEYGDATLRETKENMSTIVDMPYSSTIKTERTFYKDGDWNTLCLPFSVSKSNMTSSPLSQAVVMELDTNTSTYNDEDSVLTLNFKDAYSIATGKPYLVKWQTEPCLVIESAADWDAFAEEVNSGRDNFEKKTVRLASNISGITTTVGTEEHPFCGTFDGDGHTMTLALESDNMFCAPFANVQHADIKRLHTKGTVTLTNTSAYHASGLVGAVRQGGWTNIDHCHVSVQIRYPEGTTTVHSGGIVGHGFSSTFYMRNCLFDGSIGYVRGTGNMTNVSGLVGWDDNSNPTITNCLNAGTFVNPDVISMIARISGRGTINNCYSTIKAQSEGSQNCNRGEYTRAQGDELATLLGKGWQWSWDNDVHVVPDITKVVEDSILYWGYHSMSPQMSPVSIPLDQGNTFIFQGTFDPVNIYSKEMDNFYLGANNALKTPKSENYTLNAFRAYFRIGSSANVKSFVLNFDGETENTTSISPHQLLPVTDEVVRGDAWTDLNGRRLAGKPTRKGLYIHQGKKLVIQ